MIAETGAKVVLSSTRRDHPIGVIAARYFEIPFIDVTPDTQDAPRCGEITSWLHAHPEVTRYAVVDDSDDCLDELPLFQPSSKTGFDQAIADGLKAFLIGRSDKDMRQPAMVRFGHNISVVPPRQR